jgi:hypothetical protein
MSKICRPVIVEVTIVPAKEFSSEAASLSGVTQLKELSVISPS